MPGVKGRSGGRNKKPTKLKLIEGNRGKRKINKSEPRYSPGAVCPEYLDEIAKKEWYKLAPELVERGLLTIADQSIFANYCIAFSLLQQALEDIQESGITASTARGGERTAPSVTVAKAVMAEMRAISVTFGFTPGDRSRLSLGGEEENRKGSTLNGNWSPDENKKK